MSELASAERIGLRLRRARRALILAIPDFAELLGISATSVWHRENGRRPPLYDELRRLDPILRETFDVSVVDLLDEGSDFEIRVPLPGTSLRNLGKKREYQGRLPPP